MKQLKEKAMEQLSGSSQQSKTRVVAVIPAFNEEKYIGTVVLKTRQYVDEAIVVDDGSTDGNATNRTCFRRRDNTKF
jgi:glycosyltransferase involved in cell wall biosynthesis